jgi:hypothetical protein
LLTLIVGSLRKSRFGSDWWNNVSEGVRKKVDEMKKDELVLGWRVSDTNSNSEYLHFDHLEKIIMTNWKGVFEQAFQDQQKIALD